MFHSSEKVIKSTKFSAEAVENFYETISKEPFLQNGWVLPSSQLPQYDRPKVKDVWDSFSSIDGKRLKKKKRQHFCFLLISIVLETQEAVCRDQEISQFTRDLFPQLDSIFEKLWPKNDSNPSNELLVTSVNGLGAIHAFNENKTKSLEYYKMIVDKVNDLIQGGEKGIVTRNICDTFVQYLILLKDEKNGIKKAKKWLGGILSLIKENMDCRAKDLMPIFYFKAIVCWLVYENYQETKDILKFVLEKMRQEKGNNRPDHVDEDVKVKLGLDDEQIKNFYGKNNSDPIIPDEEVYMVFQIARVEAKLGNRNSALQAYLKITQKVLVSFSLSAAIVNYIVASHGEAGLIYYEKKDFLRANFHFRAALALPATNPNMKSTLVVFVEHESNNKLLLKCAEKLKIIVDQKLLEDDPTCMACTLGMKCQSQDCSNYHKALKHYQEARRLAAKKLFHQAITENTKAYNCAPLSSMKEFNAEILFNQGVFQNQIGDTRAAVKSLNLALEYQPNRTKAIIFLADYYFELQNYSKSLELAEKSLGMIGTETGNHNPPTKEFEEKVKLLITRSKICLLEESGQKSEAFEMEYTKLSKFKRSRLSPFDAKNIPPSMRNSGSASITIIARDYKWIQTLEKINVRVPLPKAVKSRGDIICDLQQCHLQIGVKGQPLIIDGFLEFDANEEESSWALEDKRSTVVLTFEKLDKTHYWYHLIETDPDAITKEEQKLEERLVFEASMTEEEKSDRKSHAQDLKKNGNSFYQAGENKEAINQYNLALEVCPLSFTEDRAILMANKAAALIKMDQKVEAIEQCNEAIQLNPKYVKAFLRRGHIYEEMDKTHEALKDFEKVLEIDPDHKEARMVVMILPAKIERLEFEASMTENEKFDRKSQAQDLKKNGNSLYLAGQNEEAIKQYEQALEICPLSFKDDLAILMANTASALIKMDRKAEAIEQCTEALRLNPKYVKALLKRGQMYEETDKPHQAMKDFEKILEIDPDHNEAKMAVVRLPDKIKDKDFNESYFGKK